MLTRGSGVMEKKFVIDVQTHIVVTCGVEYTCSSTTTNNSNNKAVKEGPDCERKGPVHKRQIKSEGKTKKEKG